MAKVKVGAIQLQSEFLAVEENVSRAITQIERLADQGAEIVCLPEAFNIGYYLPELDAMVALAETESGATLTALRQVAKNRGIWIVAPILFRADEQTVYNTAFFINSEGEIAGDFPKTHLLRSELDHFTRGTNYGVIPSPFGNLSCMICNDLSFPEVSRMLALNGAEIIFAPAAWQGMSYLVEWWHRALDARALDNQLFIVAVNQVGPSTHGTYGGNSKVINPRGDTLIKVGVSEESFVYEIDTAKIAEERAYNTSFFDRLPEHYSILTELK